MSFNILLTIKPPICFKKLHRSKIIDLFDFYKFDCSMNFEKDFFHLTKTKDKSMVVLHVEKILTFPKLSLLINNMLSDWLSKSKSSPPDWLITGSKECWELLSIVIPTNPPLVKYNKYSCLSERYSEQIIT